jgi:endonuclease G
MASVWRRLHAAYEGRDLELVLNRHQIGDLLSYEPRQLQIDPGYDQRPGYDEAFLGVTVPLPVLGADVADDVATPVGSDHPVLAYHHFSIVLSASRRLARWTAANLDGRRRFVLDRTSDEWQLDPRLPESAQVGEATYADNDLDRGHLVRRQDPVWGDSYEEALAANDDTFHFTNAAPQHMWFNQNPDTWLGLEDYILSTVADLRLRATVLTGPVLAETDPIYRGVAIPLEFWKVVATVDDAGELHATAYVLSQAKLIDDPGIGVDDVGPVFGPFRTFQVPVAQVEDTNALDLGPLRSADPLAGAVGSVGADGRRELKSFADITLQRPSA